ncbi:M48 family metalloprotease [Methanoculleus sp.]|uniref:M48 family metalloprotease n=1 Tax=Methanoculleus sp. TaxID=90427 RepID=UPI002FCBF388
MADDSPRLHRIFRELQKKGLIGRERRLVECRFVPAIRGCPALNSIRYRREFYERDLSGASDDTLRFVLLHEEGHIREGSSLLSVLPALPLLPCLLLLWRPPLASLFPGVVPYLQAAGLPVVKVAFVLPLLLVVFFAYRTYYRRMCDEEFTADRYAADAMRRCYRTRDPGALLQEFLSGLRTGVSASGRRKPGDPAQAIPGHLRPEPDYRPSIAERVERVRERLIEERPRSMTLGEQSPR